MRTIIVFLVYLAMIITIPSCAQTTQDHKSHTTENGFEFQKTETEWRASLSPLAYSVLREKGTEPSFSGVYNDNKKTGTYYCAGCENPLFESDTKFDSGTGWPSFYTCIGDTNVIEVPDNSHGWNRTEVVCGHCGGHLGHVFKDGPKPTGLRYCVNSASLSFKEE